MSTSAPLLGEPLPVELMNTIWADRAGRHDALSTDAEAIDWLRAVADRLPVDDGALADRLAVDASGSSPENSARLRLLRDACRRLASDVTGDPRPSASSSLGGHDEAVAALNQIAGSAPVSPLLIWPVPGAPRAGLSVIGPAGPAFLAMIASEAIGLFGGDVRLQLRACLAPGCVLYFAKEHGRREWCSSGCGNRARAARHYQRTRHPAT